MWVEGTGIRTTQLTFTSAPPLFSFKQELISCLYFTSCSLNLIGGLNFRIKRKPDSFFWRGLNISCRNQLRPLYAGAPYVAEQKQCIYFGLISRLYSLQFIHWLWTASDFYISIQYMPQDMTGNSLIDFSLHSVIFIFNKIKFYSNISFEFIIYI